MSSIIAPAKRVNLIPAGIVGGVLAGIAMDAFLLAVSGFHVAILYQRIASNLVGRVAFASGAFVALGLAIHLLVAAVWGALYAWAAQSGRPALVNRAVPCGLLYGLLVLACMQAVEVALRTYVPPGRNWGEFALLLIAHAVFFGLPVALYVSSAARRAVAR